MDTVRLARRYLVVLVAAILLFTVLYWAGMATLEGRPRSFLDALEVVMQTFTTVGYGQDAPWEHPLMKLLVVSMQAGSLLLIFSAFPAVIVPLIEESLATSLPASREDLSDHVIVCTASTRTERLIDELVDRGVPYVIVEPDRETATDLNERGREVVHGDPESIQVLRGVNAADARALVSDADDDVDMSIITAARELADDLPVYSIAEAETFAEYHELAGADEAFLPRRLLGRGLANKVRHTVDVELADVPTGDQFEVVEVPVARGSDYDGRRISEAGVHDADDPPERGDQPAADVVGVWSHGQFHVPPFEAVPLDEGSVLLAVGRSVELDSLARAAGSTVAQYGRGRIVVAGAGVVGTMVSDRLIRDDISHTVVDIEDGARVDEVGDATEAETYERVGVDDARTVVLALDDDTVTLVASFVLGQVAPDVEVVARANDAESVPKLYRAGADYVLALSTVAGRLLAEAILGTAESITLDRRIRLVTRDPGALAGSTVEEAAVRETTGCTVVALVRRDGRVSADLSPWTEIGAHDTLVVAGTDAALERLDDRL